MYGGFRTLSYADLRMKRRFLFNIVRFLVPHVPLRYRWHWRGVLLAAIFLLPSLSLAEQRTYSAIELPGDLLSSHVPAALIVREIVAPALLRKGPKESFDVGIATSLSADPLSSTASIDVARGKRFVSGEELELSDIKNSLVRCGISNPDIEEEREIFRITIRGPRLRALLTTIRDCPIVPLSLAETFKAHLGQGTAIGGISDWEVVFYDPSRRLRIETVEGAGSPASVEIRRTSNPRTALAALVRGEVDGIILSEQESTTIDPPENVLMKQCSRTTLAVRRDNDLPCLPGS